MSRNAGVGSASSPAAPPTGLRAALTVIAGSAGLLCALEISLLRYPYPDVVWVLGTLSVAGVIYVLAGVLAWDRRPGNRMGLWLVLAGFLYLAARLSNVEDPVLATIGALLAQAPAAAVLHLMLLFPSGRLQGRFDRTLVTLGYAVLVGFAVPLTLYRADDRSGAVRIEPRPDAVAAVSLLEQLCWLAILAVSTVVLVARVRAQRAVAGERRARIAVYSAGIVSIVLLPVAAQVGIWLGWSEFVIFLIQVTLIALVPVVFVGSLLVGGYARTGRLDELASWMGATPPNHSSLATALGQTLGDASLQLLYSTTGVQGFVDEAGRRHAESDIRPPAAAVPVVVRAETAALIVYDTAAVADPRLVEAAGRVVALALDRDRLTLELLAEREALKRSRARIVEVGDMERRRLARDLHDVLQGRLVLAAMQAGTMAVDPKAPSGVRESAAALRDELDHLVDQVRRVVHGVLPALLLERGLPAAAKDLVDRCRIPSTLDLTQVSASVPSVVSTNAYFVLAEAITNAVKHSSASRLEVAIDMDGRSVRVRVKDDGVGGASASGSGLRGLADRVEALDGTFLVDSPPRSGTIVQAVIPLENAAGARP